MFVFLVHHAEAVDPGVDASRPLSTRGVEQAAALAGRAQQRGVRPAVIWHSGKLRSRQTAEWFLRRCSPMAGFRAVRGLQPGDRPEWIHDALLLEDQDVLLVGHWPHLPKLAAKLGAPEELPVHGMMAFEREGATQFVFRWVERPPQVD